MEKDLLWIQEETERGPIDEIKKKLAPEFEGLPADLCDDLQICRFLRGHNNDPEEAATFMQKAVAYRSEIISKEPFKSMRASVGSSTIADVKVVPGFGTISTVIPLLDVEGQGESGLPVTLAVPRMLDFDRFNEVAATEEGNRTLEEFFRANFEFRALLLHNLSHQQHRMVKYVTIRDLTQADITGLISSGIANRLREVFSTNQDCYPESVHRVLIYSAPSAFSGLFSVVSSILNRRMQEKIKVFSRGTPFDQVAPLCDARAIWSWMSQAASTVDFTNLTIANGAQEATARWLEAGQCCKWSLTVEDGADVALHHMFIPAAQDEDVTDEYRGTISVKAGSPHSDEWTAKSAGALYICIDNFYSWLKTKTVTLTFE